MGNDLSVTSKKTATKSRRAHADSPKPEQHPRPYNNTQQGGKPEVKMEPSVQTFAAKPADTRKDRGETVMITDALSDVRVNYHINPKEIGHGHYGVVRKCMHRETKQWYAIKSIRKSKVSKIEVLKREIEILKEVKHPNIIELIEVYEDEKYLHLVTELCTGGELFDRIIAKTQTKEGHFSEHDAAKLVRDIMDAIAYCHDVKQIVHRDLKPENFLFLTTSDTAPIKIIDFGLSRHDDQARGIMKTKVGTPYYVAPEVLNREYTKSCDIWSIGVICYILLCGYPPFYGDSDTQIFESVRIGRFDFPSPEWDDISDSAKDFVRSLLKKDSSQRPTAAEAMQHKWIKDQLAGDIDAYTKVSVSHGSTRSQTFQKYLAMHKLKKAALGYIATELTQSEVGSLTDIFGAMDKDGDGSMTLSQLDEAIASGNCPSALQQKLKALRDELAATGEDCLNLKGFLAATLDKDLVMREDKIRMAFDHFRHTDDNFMTVADVEEMLEGVAQAQELMVYLDFDGDGKISFEDFRHAVEESMEEN